MTKTQRFTLAATSLGLFMIYLDALIVTAGTGWIQRWDDRFEKCTRAM